MIPQIQHAQRSFGPGSNPARAEQPDEGAAFTRVFGDNAPAQEHEAVPERLPDERAEAAPGAATGQPAERASHDPQDGADADASLKGEGREPEEKAQESADHGALLADMPFLVPLPGAGITAPADPQSLFAITAAGLEGIAPEVPGAEPEGDLDFRSNGLLGGDATASGASQADVGRPALAALLPASLTGERLSEQNQPLAGKLGDIGVHAAAPSALTVPSAMAAPALAPSTDPELAAMVAAFGVPEGRPRGSAMEAALRLNMEGAPEEGEGAAALTPAASTVAPQSPAVGGAVAALLVMAPQIQRAPTGENSASAGAAMAIRGLTAGAQGADTPAFTAGVPAPAQISADSPILFTLPPAEFVLSDPAPAGRPLQALPQMPVAQISVPVSGLPAALLDHALQTTAGKVAGGPVEVVLNPQELGRMRFEMHQHGDHMRVFLVAERPETLDLLRRHGEQLLADLRQSGFGGASLSFGNWGQQGSGPQAEILLADGRTPEDAAPVAPPPPAPRLQMATPGAGLDLRF